MIGYQWALDRLFVAGFIGPEVDAQQPATIGEIPRLSQPRLGLRVQGEVWAHPTENTLLAATVVAGTARSQLWGRTAFGYRIWNDVFVGPEVSDSGPAHRSAPPCRGQATLKFVPSHLS